MKGLPLTLSIFSPDELWGGAETVEPHDTGLSSLTQRTLAL